jgi:hypothetical protein
MKGFSLVSIDINRAASIALTRAMQEGYRMACRDNGLPIPDMVDPRAIFGFGGAA